MIPCWLVSQRIGHFLHAVYAEAVRVKKARSFKKINIKQAVMSNHIDLLYLSTALCWFRTWDKPKLCDYFRGNQIFTSEGLTVYTAVKSLVVFTVFL